MHLVSADQRGGGGCGQSIAAPHSRSSTLTLFAATQDYTIILLGGLSGRLDQTIHTLSYLHKLRKERKQVFAITDDNIGWVLDEVGRIYQASVHRLTLG